MGLLSLFQVLTITRKNLFHSSCELFLPQEDPMRRRQDKDAAAGADGPPSQCVGHSMSIRSPPLHSCAPCIARAVVRSRLVHFLSPPLSFAWLLLEGSVGLHRACVRAGLSSRLLAIPHAPVGTTRLVMTRRFTAHTHTRPQPLLTRSAGCLCVLQVRAQAALCDPVRGRARDWRWRQAGVV